MNDPKPLDRTEWLNRLEALHAKLRAGEAVADADRAWYAEARHALLASAVEVQDRAVSGSGRRRASVRVSRPVPVRLEAGAWAEQALCIDLGGGGFAVLLEAPPPVDDWIRATLLLPGGAVTVTVAVVDARSGGGLVRVAFRFSEAGEDVRARVEDALLDGILEQLVFWEDVLERLKG